MNQLQGLDSSEVWTRLQCQSQGRFSRHSVIPKKNQKNFVNFETGDEKWRVVMQTSL